MSKLTILKNAISSKAGRTLLQCKKASPEILVVVGGVLIVGGIVSACKATLKADEVLDDAQTDLAKIKEAKGMTTEVEYSDTEYAKDLTIVYTRTGWAFLKLYGPAIGFTIAGFGCVLGAHNILRQRNVALMAAYKVLDTGFKDYRRRVVQELGEETDRKFRFGVMSDKVKVTNMDENGEVTEKEEIVNTTEYNGLSEYARFFDETSTEWSKNPEYNKTTVITVQNHVNDLLDIRGHVFLNEVYDMLGMDRSTPGAVVGWVKGCGDGYIDFGLKNYEHNKGFMNGYERSALLDFNVNGVIFDLIEGQKKKKRK